MKNVRTLILGAGLAGLSAAYHLKGKDFLVIEKSDHPGGLCTTEHKDGFSFDQTGHWLHMKDERTKALFNTLFNDEFVEIVRKTFVFSHNVFTQYPFQSNTYGLPSDVIKECVLGFIKAKYENDKSKAGDNFYEWCMAYLGEGISKHFMIPYNTKIYTVHPKDYASHWCDYYVPKPTLDQVIEGAVTSPEQKNVGYNATFKYPENGGIGELPKRLFDKCEKEKFLFNVHPVEINSDEKTILFSNGEIIKYENLINSIPLKDFLKLQTGSAGSWSNEISDRMKIASVSYLNVAFNRLPGHTGHWFYIPEEKFMPYRIGSFSNIYSKLAPDGTGSAYIEYTHQGDFSEIELLKQKSVELMLEMKMIKSINDIKFMDYRKIENGYVIYHKEYFEDLKRIEKWCAENSIKLAGRYGKWTYAAMEDAILDGMSAVSGLYNI
ncbi:MAG TPA: FAD-dependent oxidoreductase [bacterium]|nr:FAD-dependent oxidoreductase [bacterium]HOG44166.1 FAD-dependent oxidoreductase [bacterium]HPY15454.1 FAD-dependent oxidoreductase [bacterium]HQB09645.1 FAD-dependent oxidoreductase [bacterium]